MFEFFREDEFVLHAFVCLSEERGELSEGGARLNALELFLPEIEPAGSTEFMCHLAGDGLRVYIGRED